MNSSSLFRKLIAIFLIGLFTLVELVLLITIFYIFKEKLDSGEYARRIGAIVFVMIIFYAPISLGIKFWKASKHKIQGQQ